MTQEPRNIAIIGAGIMGLCAAHALAKAGHRVTIFDPKGFPAANNASAMAGGMLSPWAEIEHMPRPYIEAGLHGIQVWKSILGLRNLKINGSLLLAHNEDAHMLDRFKTHLPENVTEEIDAARLRLLEPHLAGRFPRGIFIPAEAHLDPAQAMMELCRAADTLVVSFREEEKDPAYLRPEYDFIIDARGIAANDPELRGVKGETIVVKNREFELARPLRLMHPRYPLYIVPREHGVFMIGATIIEGAGNENVTVRSAMELLSAAYSLHPSFGNAEITDIRAGIRPAYADNLPRIKREGNVISCNGLFRHGYLLAPVMAECVVSLIDEKENEFMSLFRKKNENHDQRKTKDVRSAA